MSTKTGVYQLDNGMWEYRFSIIVDGKRISSKKRTDEFGKKLNTQAAAVKAREAAIKAAHIEGERKRKIIKKTVKEVFEEYRSKGRKGKAYKTLLKQDSIWNNHIVSRWGKRYVDEISVAEVNDYLAELYFEKEYAFRYVESFLKMFYLIFGQAYSRNYLAVDAYNKLCVNKDTKIKMPKLRVDDDTDIVVFSRDYWMNTSRERMQRQLICLVDTAACESMRRSD